MARKRSYQNEQTTIRKMLQEVGHVVVLRSLPSPSVFLDHEPAARFYGSSWLEVYPFVMDYVISKLKKRKT